MADAKAAKLAAARRKLKDHQQKKNAPGLSSVVAEDAFTKSQSEITVAKGTFNGSLSGIIVPDETRSTQDIQIGEFSATSADAMSPGVECGEVDEVNQQEEFHNHMQQQVKATEILVMDKRNLELKVQSLEKSLNLLQNTQAKTLADLNIAKQNTLKLDKELRDATILIKTIRSELELKCEEINKYKNRELQVVESKSDLEEKLDMTMTALTAKTTENASLQNQLNVVQRELDITQLHLQQLTNGGPAADEDAILDPKSLLEQNNLLQNKISRLEQELKCAQTEREQLISHYQQYIQQLNDNLEATMARNQQYALENESLANRENSLVDQISEMEKRMQSLQHHISILKKQEMPPSQNHQTEADKTKLLLLEEEYRNVKNQTAESEQIIIELTERIQTLQSEQPDVTKLSAANESDKVAAQRATSQNIKLKEELHGLQDAFVAMNNDKLELTEKLQAEKFLNRELTIKLSESEETLKEVQSKLMAKDEEMIRLQSSCSNMEKELFQNLQEIDRLRHYEVTQSTDEIVKRELDVAQQTIATLEHDITILRGSDHQSGNVIEGPTTEHFNFDEERTKLITENDNSSTDANLNTLPTDEAMIKLQQRFLKTMKEVAELSDEKQKLEHIVLQLQGETETICEYIALYQQQRGILKQREEERATQMKYLSSERERMQAQLEELQRMVTGGDGGCGRGDGGEAVGHLAAAPFNQQKVKEIVNLLSEIKQSHLIDPNKQCTGLENFNPCPWCSGKLINV